MKLTWNPPIIEPRKATYRWSVSYAAAVYFGAYLRNGRKLPGRPWVAYVLFMHDLSVKLLESVESIDAIADGFDEFAEWLNQQFRTAIESEIWQWNNETYRRNGSIAGSPRDIVDMGNLRDSQSMTIS